MNQFLEPSNEVSTFESSTDDERSGESEQRITHRPTAVPGFSLSEPTADSPGWRQRLVTGMTRRLLRQCGDPPIQLVLPSGTPIGTSSEPPIGKFYFDRYRTLFKLVLDPLFQFGEAYADRRIQVDGNLADCLTAIYRRRSQNGWYSPWQYFLNVARRPRSTSRRSARKNIHHHYDLGNEFYRLWLDERLVYTCAYFQRPELTLEQAQVAKMEHICRKIQLQPNQEVVEAGCGWGSLALYMAANYGVRVRAFNISKEQVDWARQQAQRDGLEDRVEFIHDDWRNVTGSFDRFVSVGMLEHVGLKNYRELGRIIRAGLRSDGLGLIHSIGQNQPRPLSAWIERRIFPGAYPPTLRQMMNIFEGPDFQILDVENLRLHYAETLRHWLRRFEASADIVREKFDERFVRMWRMYLSGSTAAFASGGLQLYQVVFAAPETNLIPRTREHQYSPPQPESIQ